MTWETKNYPTVKQYLRSIKECNTSSILENDINNFEISIKELKYLITIAKTELKNKKRLIVGDTQ